MRQMEINRLVGNLSAGGWRTFAGFVAGLVVIAWIIPAAAQTDYSPLESDSPSEAEVAVEIPDRAALDFYLRLAMERSPNLRAAFQDWQAAVKKAGYVAALPDPIISYSHFIENVETRVGPQEERFGVWQTIPWLGLLDAKKEQASAAARAAFERLEMQRLALFYEVEAAYYDYFLIGRELAITRENLDLLTFWESVARSKYTVGLKEHPDLIKVQVELGMLEDQLRSLEESVAPVTARLRALLDLPESVAIPIPNEIRAQEETLDRDSLISLVRSQNPRLLALMQQVEREKAGTRVARSQNRPSISLGFDYIRTGEARNPATPESGKDPWFVGAKISLPLWFGKNRSRSEEAAARLKSAQYDVRDAKNQLVAATDQVLFEYHDALRKLQLYRDGLVPKAEQSLNASYAAYQTGEADFLDVLDAQRQLLDFSLTVAREQASLATRRAELEMLTGSSNDDFKTGNL